MNEEFQKFNEGYEKLGAFEISEEMRQLASQNKGNTLLDAGRGNPNWINTKSRLAFSRMLEWGVEESKRTIDNGDMAGYVLKTGIYNRFMDFLEKDEPINNFLKEAINYCIENLHMEKDDLIYELTDGIIGNHYPMPSRCLKHIEIILNEYLQSSLYNGVDLAKETKVFPTEGGTAAMCYLFDTLKHNGILNPDDKIALAKPIFTPYIQIPNLSPFRMVEINVRISENEKWDMEASQIEKLKDPKIKALFLVNPSNPGSHALSDEALEAIAGIVRERDDLIIVTDDVYGTFVEGFRSIYSVIPQNTILIYSYSKLYGVTGWRTGLIAMNEKNVCDKLIRRLPKEKRDDLIHDYSIVSKDPENFPFIERICADSRNIGLYHTSGLSTPQQVFMALMSLTHLITKGKDPYFELSRELVSHRYKDLYEALGMPEDNGKLNAKYYALIDIYEIAEVKYGKDFARWMREKFDQLEFLTRLAKKTDTVLMAGVGFGAREGTVRVSQANLPDEAYLEIGTRILNVLAEYHNDYLKDEKHS